MVTSRERVEAALNHQESDMVPLDLSGTTITGMQVSSVYNLRQALGLDEPGTPVKVWEPFQMLGEVGTDLLDAIGADVLRVGLRNNFFDYPNDDWHPWTTYEGTPVLVPGGFVTEVAESGDIYMYPQGDRTARPSARMPRNGFYFDGLTRQEPFDEDDLHPEDNLEEFKPFSDEDVAFFKAEVERLAPTGRALMGDIGGMGFGDAAFVPGPGLKNPKGIRDLEIWYMTMMTNPEYVEEVFERQADIAIDNMQRIYDAVGDQLTGLVMTGTDFGAQNAPFFAPKTYRRLFQPVHARVNGWVHENTNWKTFIHSCGSIWRLLDDIVDAGFDILNPVQTSAAEMDPQALKDKYGSRVTFWGGGIDTQKILPFGTPDEVKACVRERMETFGPGGGFVFNSIHNIQSGVPVANIVALYEAVNEYRTYPIS